MLFSLIWAKEDTFVAGIFVDSKNFVDFKDWLWPHTVILDLYLEWDANKNICVTLLFIFYNSH